MSLAFVDRNPTPAEIERLRLVLSTFQDGTGMNAGGTLPGWRDFERAIAAVFGGIAQESKAVFDVLLNDEIKPDIYYGLSCKMGDQLDRLERTKHAFMELSNSAKKFWDYLNLHNISQSMFKNQPQQTGEALITLVEQWHQEISIERGGNIDTVNSFYLVLAYNQRGWYQLLQFPLKLPNPKLLRWEFPMRVRANQQIMGNLRAYQENRRVFEWYGESGGQLKYYPFIETALWKSEKFRLEPLITSQEYGILAKAMQYFPQKWHQTYEE